MLFCFILYYIEHDTSFHIVLNALLFLQLQCARAREDGERIARRGGGGEHSMVGWRKGRRKESRKRRKEGR